MSVHWPDTPGSGSEVPYSTFGDTPRKSGHHMCWSKCGNRIAAGVCAPYWEMGYHSSTGSCCYFHLPLPKNHYLTEVTVEEQERHLYGHKESPFLRGAPGVRLFPGLLAEIGEAPMRVQNTVRSVLDPTHVLRLETTACLAAAKRQHPTGAEECSGFRILGLFCTAES